MLTTERLQILPLAVEQFALLLADKECLEKQLGLRPGVALDEHTHEAMSGLIQEAARHPEDYFWYTYWMILHTADRVSIGGLCFMGGPDASGAVEIGYGVDAPYRNHGYMTEALLAVSAWAKEQNGVRVVTAVCDRDNAASVRVLEKCDFLVCGTDGKLIHWQISR